MDHIKTIEIDGKSLSIDLVHDIAHHKHYHLVLSVEAKTAILKSRKAVEDIIKAGKIVYGLNTGFGSLKDKSIDQTQLEELQENLIRSHAAGVGSPFLEAEVRAAILIRANSLANGHSGVRLELVEKFLEILNKGIYPYIPERGSCGASGDLAPLSHLALVIMGEGELIVNGQRKHTKDAMYAYDFTPLKLQAKEGLALNNGTAFLTAVASLNVYNAKNIVHWADKSLALSLEGMRGTLTAFDNRVHEIRPHKGQIETARIIRELCEGSQLVGPDNGYNSVQDSYSLRCSPQVHGPAKQMLEYVTSVVEVELNSVTDNPLVFPESGDIISGGNFHGEPIGLVMDSLSIALTELANISERRTAKFMDSNHNNGLPPYLIGTHQTGLNSGFMILQYTAAAMLAEIKVLAHPVVIDSIPTSANQEDYVSFATTASRKCRDIIEMVYQIITIELICAAQAVDIRNPLKPGFGTHQIHNEIRQVVPFFEKDSVFYPYMESLSKAIKSK